MEANKMDIDYIVINPSKEGAVGVSGFMVSDEDHLKKGLMDGTITEGDHVYKISKIFRVDKITPPLKLVEFDSET
jgi:hypothetical protein